MSRTFWLDALEGEAGSVRGVKFPAEDAGLTAVVGIELESLVSGDPPAKDVCDFLPLSLGVVICVLGVADRRPTVPYERHISLVRSMMSPAMSSKAAV